MLELQSDRLVFNFPDVHPAAKVTINFQRTLRIPDDDKEYPLPPGLGAFPVRHVEDFKARLPEKWAKRGGVMLPMFQSEALWISFQGNHDPATGHAYPFAVKVAAGKTSAVTGKPWSKTLKEKDYCVIPKQPWIDGFMTESGVVRQFVAMPLGGGFTVEEQVTGKAEFGGIQLEVLPMKRTEYERRFPKLPPRRPQGMRLMRSMGRIGAPTAAAYTYNSNTFYSSQLSVESLGLAAGGRMRQTIFDDPYGLTEWDTTNKSRCFVHLANSLTWRAITGSEPPTAPFTAEEYTRYGMPWFEYYADGPALKPTEKLKGIKSIAQIGKAKGIPVLPENTTAVPNNIMLIKTTKQVKDGVWK